MNRLARYKRHLVPCKEKRNDLLAAKDSIRSSLEVPPDRTASARQKHIAWYSLEKNLHPSSLESECNMTFLHSGAWEKFRESPIGGRIACELTNQKRE